MVIDSVPALFKRNDPRDGYDSHIDSGQIDYSFVIIQSSQSLHLKSQWFDNIKERSGLTYQQAKRAAQDRTMRREITKLCAECGRQSSDVTEAAR